MSQGVNAQTGTSYTIRRSDRGKLITFSNGAPVAVTVPQAIAQFGEGFSFEAINRGVGTVTFTPASGTINGAASLALTTNNYVRITSDGANWDAGLSGTGPAGPQGIQGIQGVQGNPGAAGLGYIDYQSKIGSGFTANVGAEVSLDNTTNPVASAAMNVLGRRMTVKGHGVFTTDMGETPTFTLSIWYATVQLGTITTGALTASVTDGPFDFEFEFITNGTGATGTVIRHASLTIDLAGTGTFTTYRYEPTGNSGNVNLTGAAAVFIHGASSANIKSVAIIEFMEKVE